MFLEVVIPIILVMSKLSFSLLLHVLKITAHKLGYLVSTFKKLAMEQYKTWAFLMQVLINTKVTYCVSKFD